jgi:hypothetical protein
MRALGFRSEPLGPDGPQARSRARELNKELAAARAGARRQLRGPSLYDWTAWNAEQLSREAGKHAERKRDRRRIFLPSLLPHLLPQCLPPQCRGVTM